jgi:hypothetical protein
MDPITLLVSGAGRRGQSGLSGTATQAIRDAYDSLKRLLARRLTERGHSPDVVEAPETEPERWRSRLAGQLNAGDVDADVQAAAQRLLAAVDPAGSKAGK